MADSADYKPVAGDRVLFYDVGKFEPSEGEVIGAKWLRAPCIVTQRGPNGEQIGSKITEDALGFVIISLVTGLPAGTFHRSCIVKKLGERRRSE